jgi:hypothetical protein
VRHANADRDAAPRRIIEFVFRPWPWPLARWSDKPTSGSSDANPDQEQQTQVVEESPEQRPGQSCPLCESRKAETSLVAFTKVLMSNQR